MKYAVAIVYKGQSNFIVETDDGEERAEEIATDRFKNGGTPDVLGNEYETIENIVTEKL